MIVFQQKKRKFILQAVAILVMAILVSSYGTIRADETGEKGTSSNKPTRVLLVVGGHGYDRENLHRMILARPKTELTEITVPEEENRLAPGLEKEFDVVIFHDQSFFELSENQKKDLSTLFENGMPVLMLHHALISHNDIPLFRELYGAAYIVKPMTIDGKDYQPSSYKKPVDVHFIIKKNDHPITRGVDDFTMTDEVFGGLWLADDNDVLIETDHPESVRPILWTRHFKKTPVVSILPGHDGGAFNDPRYRKLIFQAIDWLVAEKK